MDVTKEMIEAAKAETAEEVLGLLTAHELYQYRPKAFQGFIDYVRKHFAAASLSRSAEAGKPVVKGLEWRTTDDRHDAGSIVGRYTIEGRNPGYGLLVPAPVAVRLFIDLDAAKAAAQADYEARIRSALSTPADIEPVLFVSEQQLASCIGTYLPTRKERGGNFQFPLYAAPVADRERHAVKHAKNMTDPEISEELFELGQVVSLRLESDDPVPLGGWLYQRVEELDAEQTRRTALAAQGDRP